MSNLKKFGVVLAAVFALAALAASSASAQLFTASAASVELTGMSNTAQVFNTTAGSNLNKITCNTATVTGNTKAKESREQTVTVDYSSSANAACAAFIGNANISAAQYLFTLTASNADMNLDTGTVHVENSIHISTNVGCNVTVEPQTPASTVTFQNDSANAINVISGVNGIVSNGNGGLCGNHHENGSYTGTATVDSNSFIGFDITG